MQTLQKNKHFKAIKFFKKYGFLKISIFSRVEIEKFKNQIINDLNKKLKIKLKSKIKIDKLENYHNLNIGENEHKFLVNPNHRYLKFKKKTIKKILNKEILYVLNKEWGHSKVALSWIGNLKKKQKIINATGYRLARPYIRKKNDTADVHIDINAGGIINKDKKSSATIWIPIIGFDKKFTLRISPKSHKKNHGNKFKKTKKISPMLPKSYCNKFKFTRLNFKPGEAIMFHPNLLHGGSNNYGSITRVSLDTRILNLKRFIY
tara:strand:- start:39 stop:824 length:786 start_codon:yes stop_codon:yes gene_type:complete